VGKGTRDQGEVSAPTSGAAVNRGSPGGAEEATACGTEVQTGEGLTNHCVAERRRPCTHSSFGQLKNVETSEVLQLEYGFQLECRFCKKFEVNAALNPQRTAAQMKEDAARRRAFELLLTELYEGSPSLLYRHETGRGLADDVWERFGGRCSSARRRLRPPKTCISITRDRSHFSGLWMERRQLSVRRVTPLREIDRPRPFIRRPSLKSLPGLPGSSLRTSDSLMPMQTQSINSSTA
jgi:hypothetical protein